MFATAGDQHIDLPASGSKLVGRAATSDVPIFDPTISRRHAELQLAAGGVLVRDLGSSNGTFLNGARISEATATDGDVVTFGKVAFHVRPLTPRRGSACRRGRRSCAACRWRTRPRRRRG
jgi:predicted component of type VI protein secretion system